MVSSSTSRFHTLLVISLILAESADSMSLSKYSIRQAINFPGLKKAVQAIFKPSLLIPQLSVNSVNDLDFIEMKRNGINCIVFDKDNTLR